MSAWWSTSPGSKNASPPRRRRLRCVMQMTGGRFCAFVLSSLVSVLVYDYALLMSGVREYLLDDAVFRENRLLLVWGLPIALTIVLSVTNGSVSSKNSDTLQGAFSNRVVSNSLERRGFNVHWGLHVHPDLPL